MKRSYSGSLVRRILLTSFILIVVPLLAYIGFIWDRDWRIKLKNVLTEFELKAEAIVGFYQEWLGFRLYLLDHFTKEITVDSIETKFVFDSDFVCTFSTEKQMEGARDFFPNILREASRLKELVFSAVNPYTQQSEIFVLKQVGEELRGLSVARDTWIEELIPDHHFVLELVSSSSNLGFNLEEFKQLRKEMGFFAAHSLRTNPLTLRLSLPHALFSLEMTLSKEEIAAFEGGNLFHSFLFFLGLILLLGAVATWWLVRKMEYPLRQLGDVMGAVGVSDYSKRYQPSTFGFEINALGNHFNQMVEALLENIERAKEHELFAQELQIGREVQNRLLPKELPQLPGHDFGWGFLPAQEVAGDFYDLFLKRENELMLTVADGSGKGVSACLYTLMLRSLLRSDAYVEEDLAKVISSVNHLFCQDTGDTGNFVTAWVGFYHLKERKLVYASAGHLPGLLIHSNGELEELTTKGMAFGAAEMGQVETHTVYLEPGDLILLYTDGVTEAHNEKGELFGKSRLYGYLKQYHLLSPQPLIDQLITEVNSFSNSASQHDDVTLVGFKSLSAT